MASNNPVPPWIASFVERCLAFYIGQTPDSGVKVEDDGTYLKFCVSQPTCLALVSQVSYSLPALTVAANHLKSTSGA